MGSNEVGKSSKQFFKVLAADVTFSTMEAVINWPIVAGSCVTQAGLRRGGGRQMSPFINKISRRLLIVRVDS